MSDPGQLRDTELLAELRRLAPPAAWPALDELTRRLHAARLAAVTVCEVCPAADTRANVRPPTIPRD